MKVLIVTVAYNPPQSILSKLNINYYPHLVVDNSEQETTWLKSYCLDNNHAYVWLGDNLGIAKALNVGAEYAIKHGFDYIVTMDQDSLLTNQLLDKVTKFILDYQDSDTVAIFSPRHINEGADLHNVIADVTNDFYTMSSGNFLKLSIWQKLGQFDESLFIDMVDVDFYIRALINGYKVLTIQHITMLHYMGNRSHIRWIGKYGFDVWNHDKVRKYYQARNFFHIYKKYRNYFPEVLFIKKMIRKMPITILFFENNKMAKLYYFFRGYIDFLRGKFGKIYF